LNGKEGVGVLYAVVDDIAKETWEELDGFESESFFSTVLLIMHLIEVSVLMTTLDNGFLLFIYL